MPPAIILDDQTIIDLHSQNMPDKQIGAIMGCSHVTIAKARHRLGLPPVAYDYSAAGSSGGAAAAAKRKPKSKPKPASQISVSHKAKPTMPEALRAWRIRLIDMAYEAGVKKAIARLTTDFPQTSQEIAQ